ncbi:AraC family transcriptional regulator [Amycolatopsis alkalitolerans]|uniref:AraC family transcriptional regulator n=1 Tax=Amycolatopsis alkalitolerans TaxID=2547244 RepID=A0A5C4M2C4_9PSEU|nr:AraC family transcriptional regulator [Amycolatopsis alkalitolerans]TNC25169.1 AraC family transcriptional regulator [Amycolatopsis alkalitolerans]
MPAVSIRTSDPDEACGRCGEVYFPHRLTVLHDPATFRMSLSATRIGPVSAGLLSYAGEVRLTTGELETGYEINVPLDGVLYTRTSRGEVCADPGLAAVYSPDTAAMLHGWAGGGSLFGLKIDRAALETQLADLIDAPVRSGVRLDGSITLRQGPGRQWWALARSLVELAREPDGPLSRPMVARPLVQSVITGLLHAVEHPYRDRLVTCPRRPPPESVRRAVELLETEPELPWTVVDLARRSGLSTRALQEGFLRHVGRSPMAYLRTVRLRHAHADLVAADPARHTVAGIAGRWGFVHLGRFAAAYRERYGSAPSETLHRLG